MSELPLSKSKTIKAVKWLKDNFGHQIRNAVIGTPFTEDTICGIACQETAYRWVEWIDKYDPAVILRNCVFDATGDVPGTEGKRSAFPVNLNDFEKVYGKEVADRLIAESNSMRKLLGWSPRTFLYKGYGIFQYDLQYIQSDPNFFLDKQWYSFDKCLEKCMMELKKKYAVRKTVPGAVEAYNGSGPRAVQYSKNVMEFTQLSSQV